MELVINISEETYNGIKKNGYIYDEEVEDVALSIIGGTPLPKGHGRLKDADKLKEEFKSHHDFYVNAYGGFENLPRNEKSRVDEITASIASIVNSPTIIEAEVTE